MLIMQRHFFYRLANFWQACLNQWKTRFFGSEESLPKKKLLNASPLLTQRVSELVKELSDPFAYRQAIQSALKPALEQWQKNPHTSPNSLVILGSPIQSVASILENNQNILQTEKQIPINFLQWHTLPTEPAQILAKLQKQLKRVEEHQEIVLIPNLSSLFLRCINGLEVIEYIRNIVSNDCSRFWIIGSHDWAWEYLNLGCQIDSYFEQIMLPTLNPGQLQEWLAPIIAQAEISFKQQQKKLEIRETQQNLQKMYFEKLAQISDGFGSLALQLFLHSLECKANNSVSNEEKIFADIENLSLPDLPTLAFEEHYLLFSLLIHEKLSVAHLSHVLGQIENFTYTLVQDLQNAKLIEQDGELFQVNLIYYPQIRDSLDKNGFLIAKSYDTNYKKIIFK